jgi:HlyD family secretion protein
MTESTCPANDLGLISRPMSADTETSTAHFEGAANHSANHSRDGASGGARAAKVRPRFTASKKTSSARLVTLGLAILLAGGGIAMRLRAAPVKAAVVARGTAVEAVYATGTVEPFERVIVKARAAGTIDLKVREGDRVRKGDLLALIDSPTLRHELDRGRADFWAASHQAGSSAPQLAALKAQARSLEAELHTVRGDRGRELRLVASGSAAQAELDRLVDKSASLEAELAANVAQQEALGIDLKARALGSSAAVDSLAARLSDTEVRAPMDGVVLSRFVEPGELVMVNSPLLKVGSGDNLVLECAIDEADIGRVALGSRVAVSLYAFPQAIYQGELFEISPDADRVKRSFLAKVKLIEPPAGLRSGMTTEVNVVIDERPGALLVPADAVDANGGVLVVANGRIQRRTPQLGVHDLLRVEVTRGLSEGEQVVVEGGDALDEGARVTASVRPPSVGRAAQPGTARAGMSL